MSRLGTVSLSSSQILLCSGQKPLKAFSKWISISALLLRHFDYIYPALTCDNWHHERLFLLDYSPKLYPTPRLYHSYIFIYPSETLCVLSFPSNTHISSSSSKSHLSVIIVITCSATHFEESDNGFKITPCCHNQSETETPERTHGHTHTH